MECVSDRARRPLCARMCPSGTSAAQSMGRHAPSGCGKPRRATNVGVTPLWAASSIGLDVRCCGAQLAPCCYQVEADGVQDDDWGTDAEDGRWARWVRVHRKRRAWMLRPIGLAVASAEATRLVGAPRTVATSDLLGEATSTRATRVARRLALRRCGCVLGRVLRRSGCGIGGTAVYDELLADERRLGNGSELVGGDPAERV
jgi:hypothetical protein